MGRPSKQTVDFFSHDCMHTKTMEILEVRFGTTGYALWWKLLEVLGSTEGHTVDFSDEILLEHFSGVRNRISVPETLQILEFLARISAIDPELWKNRVVWCQHFVDRLADVYAKRKCLLPGKPSIRVGNPIDSPETTVQPDFRGQESTKESRVEDSRVKKRRKKEAQNIIIPEWIPPETWQAFLDMRRSVRKPATPLAQELIIADLAKFKDQGYDPIAILEKSIKSSWQDVYPPKGDGNGKPGRIPEPERFGEKQYVGDDPSTLCFGKKENVS